LLLPSGQLLRISPQQLAQPQALHQMRLPTRIMPPRQSRLKRQIVLHPQAADQVELLEHQTDLGTPPVRQLAFVHLLQAMLATADTAAIHLVQTGDQVQQGALATARLAHQCQAATGFQGQIDPLQHRQWPLGSGVAFEDTADFKHGRTCWMSVGQE
jgi:hypothetical protein